VRRFLYIFALGFPVFLAFTGAAGIMTIQVKVGASTTETNNNTSIAFMGIYMIIFAALMFIYECCVICPISIVDNWMKKNFGFMYGPIGRGKNTSYQ
jgi:polyferredoxin